MPDRPPGRAGERRAAAIAGVEVFVATIPGGGRMSARHLEQYHKKDYELGWRVPVKFSDGKLRQIHILADGGFPYTAPRIAVAKGPGVLAWPHLERDGLLCILPTCAAVSSEDPVRVVEYVLGEACRLIEECIGGTNADDFREEFLSYWVMAVNEGASAYTSLLEPRGPGRRFTAWHGKRARFVGEDEESLRRWLSRWSAGACKGQDYKLHDGVLIWLPEPLMPAEYPRTAADVRGLAWHHSPEAADVLEELVASGADEIDVLLGANTSNGTCFAAAILHPPHQSGGPRRMGNPLVAGFRPGHVPRDLLVGRYLSGGTKVTRATVERADHHWIHGRDQDPRQERLRCMRVAHLGCGSVGGPLAQLLAQAGVGHRLLVDREILEWPNVGRHELGAQSVGCSKASELAREIEEAFPHLGDVVSKRELVGHAAKSLMDELASYDLIICTMGDWAAENFLNEIQQQTDDFPPILYGWVEPHAAAAHAVFVPRGGACLRCGTNDKGHPHLRATDWPKGGDEFQAPACGAVFTPYGPAELCWAHALLSETAIKILIGELREAAYHRIWIGLRDRVETAGGVWAAKWIAEMGDPGSGGMVVERPWPALASCPVCACQARAA
ncbi:MAG: ThiF family adenylyltransferase [Alphaproteobacteria bacterium]